ncbi:mannitol dehydrogenase family protein [Agromyces larvae]|uniref:Mannitol dehydrogenase family protein n=1 Tax=Agromyces larvae TaxID=2929802 RepID=A0ABY4BZ37_9MICO|nr:mannitol dehydrogenase family protein [Agromyces larvae]UOE43457.1 mannitol dehydrogenase family protein [Agromyces larvae]
MTLDPLKLPTPAKLPEPVEGSTPNPPKLPEPVEGSTPTPTPAPRLTRARLADAGRALPAPPVRIVHVGAGAFHRTHQAWFTARASDAADWGIAAFTGRSPDVADRLAPQGGVFTLVERGPEGDRFEQVGSIVEAHPAARIDRFVELLADPAVAVVTLTITEAGYRLGLDGTIDLTDSSVAHDLAALRAGAVASARLRTPLARIVLGLAARRRAQAGPIAIVSCDNLPDNARITRDALRSLADMAGLGYALDTASFVATSVDRITPHTTAADLDEVEARTGWRDEAAVVAEPFADWTLSGEFPAGRPAWDTAGARFVDRIEPFEQRKLLVLNGGHLVLAFEGLLRGHTTVADAVADPACRSALDAFWTEAARAVARDVDTVDYRRALIERFENRRIEHRLAQIAVDTATKLRLRVQPVIEAERAAGRDAAASTAVVDAWHRCRRAGLIE